jgi:flagellar motor switch protein FliG
MAKYGIAAYQKTLQAEKKSDAPAAHYPNPNEKAKKDDGTLKLLAGLEKQTIPPPPVLPENKYRRTAKFLILLGHERASEIMGNLDEEQVLKISEEIATIAGVTKEEAASLYAEFSYIMGIGGEGFAGGATYGGIDAARRLLKNAFGEEKGERLFLKAVPDAGERHFDFLENLDSAQINFLLHDESPATAALILSRISAPLSAAVISASKDAAWRTQVMLRIAKIDEVMPEVLQSVADSLRKKAEKAQASNDSGMVKIDGAEKLAAILKAGSFSIGEKIIDEIAGVDAELGLTLKEKLLTENDVIEADDRKIADKLRACDEKNIVLILKNSSQEFREKILSNVSSSRRALIREEEVIMGPVLRSDADNAKKEFMAWFREKVEQGEIILGNFNS